MVDKIIFDADLDSTRGMGIDSTKAYIKVDSKTINFNSSGMLQVRQLTGPVFTYDQSGKLSVVSYYDGTTKNFFYSNSGKLLSIVTNYSFGQLLTKTLVYTNNVLTSITESYA